MSGIFISYRRTTTAATPPRLLIALAARFGHDQAFMDLGRHPMAATTSPR
jgi:hypothetical protein